MRKNFFYDDIRSQFLEFMRSVGVEPYDERDIIIDGNIHRFRVHDDKSYNQSGALCIFPEGLPAGFVQDWRRGIKENWKYDITGLKEEERSYFESEEFRQKSEEERRKADEERQKKRMLQSDKARILWENLPEAPGDHAYLTRKKVTSYGLRINPSTGDLAVPLRNIKGELMSIQWIPADAGKHKRFFDGASLEGAFFSIGLSSLSRDKEGIILLGEGYATMAKVHELTEYPCVAAMSCFRLKEIAKILHEDYPQSKIVITADNDKGTELEREYNPGIREAQAVLKLKIAQGVIWPEFASAEDGTDFDDYALKAGDEATASLLRDKIEQSLKEERRLQYEVSAQELGELKSEVFSEFVKPLPGAEWLINHWLLTYGTVMLFAPSGSGKSFVMLDMAFAVACEEIREWQGEKVLKHGTVIYFAGEGHRGMRKRCAGLSAAKGISPERVKMHIISDPLWLDESPAEQGIKKAIANVGRIDPSPALVIFDTTNCYMSGDENKTVDVTNYLHSCKEMGGELGCTVTIVNHTGHSTEKQTHARGSSVFRATVDTELKVSKDGRVITLEMTKSKDTALPPAKKFVLETVEVPGYYDESGNPETTCILTDALEMPYESQKPVKRREGEEIALQSYKEAAKSYGQLIQLENGQEHILVKKEDWRKVFYEESSSESSDTKRQQFNRACKRLSETLGILTFEKRDGQEYYSLKASGDAYELEILTHIHLKTRT